jgi:hypothetical protein
MLSDTDAACVGIALAVCSERKKRIAAGPVNGTKLNRPDPCTRNRRLTTYYKWSDRARRAGKGWVPRPVFSSSLKTEIPQLLLFDSRW